MHFSLSTAIFPLAVFAAAVPKPVVKSNAIAIKLTKHDPFPNSDNTVDVHRVKAHVESINAKILRGFDNYEKNTGTPHPYAVNGSGMRERGAGIHLTSERQQVWLGEISIGTPPKTLNVEIVTGSCDMFVISTQCTTTSCMGYNSWDPKRSSTSRFRTVVDGQPKEFELEYGDYTTVSGILYVDNVTISGFTANEQTFGAASDYFNPAWIGNEWAPDGQLGLAFQSISAFPIPSKPLLATLVYEEVTEPVFSLMLAPDGGELYIGGVNPDHYRGEFTYAYVNTVGFWQVEIQSIQDNMGKLAKVDLWYRAKIPAIIDTGCNYIIGDSIRVSVIHSALGGTYIDNRLYAFPCHSFPTISFSFGGKSFQIPPALLNLGETSSGSNLCFSSIVAGETEAEFWTIGNPFLQGYYTTFDFGDNPRVGFAHLQ